MGRWGLRVYTISENGGAGFSVQHRKGGRCHKANDRLPPARRELAVCSPTNMPFRMQREEIKTHFRPPAHRVCQT